MKIIFKIAKAELRTLFYSPIAWVILVAFFVVTGIYFVTPLMNMARAQEVEIANNPSWQGFQGPLTIGMFKSTIARMLSYLYLFIPLLTMGTISREVNSGSMNLLSSSPIRIREIIIGKYLGLLLFNLVLMSSIAFLLFTGYFTIDHAELKWYLTMMLGFWLLSSAYLSIGLFISCLTNYQIMAGIASFVIFFVLSQMGTVWQQYDLVRDITWFLSIDGRTESMMLGLITTSDLLYYLLIIVLFLGLSMIKLKTRQESTRWTVPFSRNLAWVILILMAGYFSSRPGYIGYLDVTRDQRNTIDSATQAVFRELDGSPITVTLYSNLFGGSFVLGLPEARNKYIWGFWGKYIRFYPNIKFRYVYYYDYKKGDSTIYFGYENKTLQQIAKSRARMYKIDMSAFKTPEEIKTIINFGDEPLKLLMHLEYKGKWAYLRTFNTSNPWPDQPNVSGTIRRLSRERLPHLSFITGHHERSPWRSGEREFGSHINYTGEKPALINNGVNADTISLLHSEIPDSTDLLVVADPKSAYTPAEQQKIISWLNKGGNAIFYAEPGKQQMLNPVLNQVSVKIDSGILVAPGKHNEGDAFNGIMTKAGNLMAREPMMQLYQQLGKAGARASFNGSSTVSYLEGAGFTIEPIVTVPGKKNVWIEKGVFVQDSAAPQFAAHEGDIKKDEYVLAVKMSRKINGKEQRIVVCGDADFMSPDEKNGMSIGTGLYSWLLNNEYPVYTKVKIPADRKLTIGKATGKLIWYVYVYIIPGLLLALGAVIIIRRMRK